MKKNILFLICLISISGVASATEAQLVDRVIAVVNDEAITQSELDVILYPVYEQMKTEYEGEDLIVKFNEVRRKILSQLIEDRLVFQEAKTRGIELEESVVEEQLEEIKKKFPDEQAMETALKAQGLTLRDLRERLERQEMVRRLQDVEIRSKILISPKEIEDYYREHVSEFSHSDRLKVRSLTIKKSYVAREKGLTDEEAKDKIDLIRSRILAGEEFAELAEKYSEDIHAKEGGLNDWVSRHEMIPVIDEVIFSLKKNAISDIVETPMGYHLFRLEAREQAYQKSFEEVRSEITEILYRQKTQQRFEEWMQELKKNAYISIR